MRLRDIINHEDVVYSKVDGGYHKDFSYNGKNYKAHLAPFALSGSACTIIKIDDLDDVNNVTAPEDKRKVFYKRYIDFKEKNIIDAIIKFITDYAK